MSKPEQIKPQIICMAKYHKRLERECFVCYVFGFFFKCVYCFRFCAGADGNCNEFLHPGESESAQPVISVG